MLVHHGGVLLPQCLQRNGQGSGKSYCFAQASGFFGNWLIGKGVSRESITQHLRAVSQGFASRPLQAADTALPALPFSPSTPEFTEQQLPAPLPSRTTMVLFLPTLQCWCQQLPVPMVTKARTQQGAPPQPRLLLPTDVVCDLILLTEKALLMCSVV